MDAEQQARIEDKAAAIMADRMRAATLTREASVRSQYAQNRRAGVPVLADHRRSRRGGGGRAATG